MKPMTDESASEETRRSAQNTLYTCLDHGLRLLHPFMPYVTEELWQRLPRRSNDPTPSIMLSAFPVHVSVCSYLMTRSLIEVKDDAFVAEKAETDFDLVFKAIRTGRSLSAQFNIQSNIQRPSL